MKLEYYGILGIILGFFKLKNLISGFEGVYIFIVGCFLRGIIGNCFGIVIVYGLY